MKKMCMMLLAALASTGSLFAIIRIDGDFLDWSTDLPYGSLLTISNDGQAKYENLYKAEFFADQMYIYYRLEFNADSVNAFEIFLDFDGDNTNGYSGTWQQSGANYVLEVVKDDWLNEFGASLCRWKEGGDPNTWDWEVAEDIELDASVSRPVAFGLSSNTVIEGRFYYPAVCANPDSIRVGVMTLRSDWETCGLLPQINSGDTVSRDPMPFVKVTEGVGIWTTAGDIDYLVNFGYHEAMAEDANRSLTSVVLPATINFKGEDYSVRSVNELSFSSLINLEYEEGWQEINYENFIGSRYLECITFPSTLQSIEYNCFVSCPWLKKMIVKAQTPPTIFGENLYSVNYEIPVYVPDESVDLYKGDAFGGQFNIQPMSSLYQGVHSTKMDTKATKRIVNGQLFIDRDGKTYNALGWH